MEKELKVYVVDDDVFMLQLVEQYLKNISVSDITLYQDVESCLYNLNLHPDIIFLKSQREVENSLEVLKEVKRINPDIYVVLFSSHENLPNAVESLRHGAFDYLVKNENIEKSIHNVINRVRFIQVEIQKNNNNFIQNLFSFI